MWRNKTNWMINIYLWIKRTLPKNGNGPKGMQPWFNTCFYCFVLYDVHVLSIYVYIRVLYRCFYVSFWLFGVVYFVFGVLGGVYALCLCMLLGLYGKCSVKQFLVFFFRVISVCKWCLFVCHYLRSSMVWKFLFKNTVYIYSFFKYWVNDIR